ncbi:TolC family protein [Leptothoe kymatousa]|nr:TolC family protein [Leptothoe kymatousa]
MQWRILALAMGLTTLATPLAAQTGLPELPSTTPNPQLTEQLDENLSSPTDGTSSLDEVQALVLTDEDVVTLLLQNNLELRNAALARIAQRQQLKESESVFDPDFTPTLRLGIEDVTGRATEITREAQLGGELLTPLGTTLEATIDVLDDQDLDLTVTQPLLRRAGRAVNTAPVEIARLQETNNQLNLQQQLIDNITQGIRAYHALIRAEANVRIQRLSLDTQRQQRRLTEALVNAGRVAQFDLVNIDASLVATEANVLATENDLEQAKSNLLDLLDISEALEITVAEQTLEALKGLAQSTEVFLLADLVQVAYESRPDYRQAQLDLEVAQLNGIVAADNRRWDLDLRANATTGDFSQASAELVLTRILENESLETAFQQNQVQQQQLQNTLERLRSDIRLEVADQLRNVESARSRIEVTRLARELAERQLQNAQARARRGRTRNIFEELEFQNDVVEAQNDEVGAAIDLADAIAALNQSLGTTLTRWSDQVEASQLLVVPILEQP